MDAGAAAVWVSNHGGRQLDRVVATAALRGTRCAQAVAADAEVYVDGGIRSGLDVLLAAALGADAAFVGRPLFHALAAGGVDGVSRALEELGAELVESLRLAGCRRCRRRGESPVRTGDSAPDRALTCVNSSCDRGHSEPI